MFNISHFRAAIQSNRTSKQELTKVGNHYLLSSLQNFHTKHTLNMDNQPSTESRQSSSPMQPKKRLSETSNAWMEPFVCGECGFAAACKRNLKWHMFKHGGEKPFKCDQCGYAAIEKSRFAWHMEGHTPNKTWKCTQCVYSTDSKLGLTRHMAVHIVKEENVDNNDACASSSGDGNGTLTVEETPVPEESKGPSVMTTTNKKRRPSEIGTAKKVQNCSVVSRNATSFGGGNGTRTVEEPSIPDKSKRPSLLTTTNKKRRPSKIGTGKKALKFRIVSRKGHPNNQLQHPIKSNDSPQLQHRKGGSKRRYKDSDSQHEEEKPRKRRRLSLKEGNSGTRRIKPSPYNLSKPYKCGQCDYHTNEVKEFDRHLVQHTDGGQDKSHLCGSCPFSTVSNWKLNRHIIVHRETKQYRCHLCSFQTKYEDYLPEHIKTRHSAEKGGTYKPVTKKASSPELDRQSSKSKLFKCRKCQFVSPRKCAVLSHIKTHTKKAPQNSGTPECSELQDFYTEKDHESSKEREFKCKMCEFVSPRKCAVLSHIKTHTRDLVDQEAPQNYDTPGRSESQSSFPEKDHQTPKPSHIKTHTKDFLEAPQNSTPECSESQPSNSFLENDHQTPKPKQFKCSKCEFVSLRKCAVLSHMKTHATEAPQNYATPECSELQASYIEQSRQTLQPRRFKCSKCAFVSRHKCAVLSHIKSHTREAPQKSSTPKVSSPESQSNEHVMKYRGNRLYSCSKCEYVTALKAAFVHHKNTHTEEAPHNDSTPKVSSPVIKDRKTRQYSCSKCEYVTALKAAFVHHTNTHTEEAPHISASAKVSPLKSQSGRSRRVVKRLKNGLYSGKCNYTSSLKASFSSHAKTKTEKAPNSQVKVKASCIKSHPHKDTAKDSKSRRSVYVVPKPQSNRYTVQLAGANHYDYHCAKCEYVTIYKAAILSHVNTHTWDLQEV